MESFKSRQFADKQPAQPPLALSSHSRKMYPELVSVLNMQIKQERLLKLERENHPTSSLGLT
jgi:hypothetical protein